MLFRYLVFYKQNNLLKEELNRIGAQDVSKFSQTQSTTYGNEP